jgi:hypothetical protein
LRLTEGSLLKGFNPPRVVHDHVVILVVTRIDWSALGK